MPSRVRVLSLAVLLAMACSKRDGPAGALAADWNQPAKAGTPIGAAGPAPEITPPTTELETVRDPVEDAYTLGMPKGWNNRTYSARVLDVHSLVATSVSPNGSVLIFSGDPGIPQYWNPAGATPIHHKMARDNPRMKIEPFVPATSYFPGYVKRKFGGLPGFELLATEHDAAAEARMRGQAAAAGVRMSATAARVTFRYRDGQSPMRALILGVTTNTGPFWMATVSGIASAGDPNAHVPTLEAMGRSHRVNPAWQAAQNRKHQERMAQIADFGRRMTAGHRQRMAAIQQSAQRHQQRMRALSAQGEANTKAFQQRMAASDAKHRGFLNTINEEHTVVGASGQKYQVDSSYQRYFVNKRSGAYVGGDIRMSVDKLRGLGLNPDDYEEVKIER